MNKFLPTSILSEAEVLSVNRKGFTLVELLVVITIIAILSVVGMTVFTGVQKNARDARRRADIDAIIKALEVNRTASGYIVLNSTQFANGAIPATDPQGIVYCANTTASATPTDPATTGWSATACPSNYSPVSATIPPAGTAWKVCTLLEAGGTGGVAAAYCRTNSQ